MNNDVHQYVHEWITCSLLNSSKTPREDLSELCMSVTLMLSC